MTVRLVAFAIFGLLAVRPALAAEGDRTDMSGEKVVDVTAPKDVADRAAKFEDSLKKLGFPGRVAACQGMVDLPAGTEGGDHAYGAVCKLDQGGKQSEVLLCDDTLFGHFAMAAEKFGKARDDVALFVDENCTGDAGEKD
jgi:hypothetical protein